MLHWDIDNKDRYVALDEIGSITYKISFINDQFELSVFRKNSKRSVDRSLHPNLISAQSYADSRVLHERQLTDLNRLRKASRVKTPWGQSRFGTFYGRGIVFYSTATNEGFYVPPETNSDIPEGLRIADGWYQDDGDGARVTLSFPHLFTDLEIDDAILSAQQAFPEVYEIKEIPDSIPQLT